MKKTRLNLLLSGLLLAIPAAFGGVDDEYLALRRSVGDGHFEEALRRSMSLIRQYPGYLYFYETLAEVAHYAQKDSLALQEFEERIEDGTELGLAYYGLGVTCCNLKNYQSAVLCFTKAIDAGNVTAECHRRFEMAYEKMEGIDAAISYFNLLCRRDPSNPNSWYRLALAYWSKQDVKKVASCLDEALAKRPHERRFLQAKAALLCLTGRQRRARPLIDSLLSRCDRELDFEGRAFLESYLATLTVGSRHVETTMLVVEDVVRIGKKFGFMRWLGWGSKVMADAFTQRGEFKSARLSISEAVTISRSICDPELLTASLISGVDICNETGDYPEALKMALEANTVSTNDRMIRTRLVTLRDIAWILHELGANEIALDYAVEALNEGELHNADPGLMYSIRMALGFAHEGLGKLEDALKDFKEASHAIPLDAFRGEASSLSNTWIGRVLLKQGRLNEARIFLDAQLQVARANGYVSAENSAEVYLGLSELEGGRYREASFHLANAIARAAKMGQRPLVLVCCRGLSVLKERRGYASDAVAWREKAIQESEAMGPSKEHSLSEFAYDWDLVEDYKALTFLLCKLGRFEEAFEAAEKAKVALAIPFLTLRDPANITTPMHLALDSLRKTIMRIHSEIASADRSQRVLTDLSSKIQLLSDLNGFELVYQRIIDSLQGSRGGSPLSLNRYMIPVNDLKAKMSSRSATAVLEFVVRSSTTMVFVVRDSSINCVDIGVGRDELLRMLHNSSHLLDSKTNRGIVSPSVSRFDLSALHALYCAIMEPISNMLRGVSEVVIVPDDVLCGIPFEILVTEYENPPDGKSAPRTRFLVEDLTISYSLVATLMREGHFVAPERKGSLLAIGIDEGTAAEKTEGAEDIGLDRFPENSSIPNYFPGVQKEIESIRTMLGDHCDIVSGSSISKPLLVSMLGQYRYIHLAGHIEVDRKRLLYSTICVSPPSVESQSNSLHAFELVSSFVNAGMVVLSGCSTACSEPGDCPEGLAGFLICVGARSSVGTKWPIDDGSTGLLMKSYYARLCQGEEKSHALQLAKTDMINMGKSDPFYWGAFVLIGDTSPLDWQAPENTKGSKTVWLAGPMSVIVAICVVVYFRRRTGKSTYQK
jgi:CHAT domain-containing protein